MNIVVTGGTGFTGKRVLPLLAGRAKIRVLVRKSSDLSSLSSGPYEVVYGDFNDLPSLQAAFAGQEGLINIGSLGFGHGANIVKAAQESGIKRALFVSTTSIFTKLPVATKSIRLAAETSIMTSKLDWTILRPTMIYGGPDDRNMARLLKLLRRSPLVVIPGDGGALQQPIFVEDLAQAIVEAFFSQATIRKAYNLSGKEALSFNEMIDIASSTLGKKRAKLHVPLKVIRPLVRFYEKITSHPRIKEEQVLRLAENKSFDHAEAMRDFGFTPRDYRTGIQEEARVMGLAGILKEKRRKHETCCGGGN